MSTGLLEREDQATDSGSDGLNPGARHEQAEEEKSSGLPNIANAERSAFASGGVGFYNPAGDKSDKSINGPTPENGIASAEKAAKGFFSNLEGAAEGPGAVAGNLLVKAGLTKKRNIVVTVLAAVLISGAFFGVELSSGPGQAIQLGQILQKSFAKNDSDSARRLGNLFRYVRFARTGDIGETRVGIVGSRVFGNGVSQLDNIGVSIDRAPATGVPTRTTIDMDKYVSQDPKLKAMSESDIKAVLADRLGVSADQISVSGSKYIIDQTSFDMNTSRLLGKNTLKLLGNGKIVTAMKFRVFTKFWNLPGIWHPLRALADRQNKQAISAAQQQEEQAKEEAAREAALTEGVEESPATTKAVDEAESSLGSSAVSGALTFTAFACGAETTAGDIQAIDNGIVKVPAEIHVADTVAFGAGLMYGGKNATLDQARAKVATFSDGKGGSIWQGKALQALAGGDTTGLTEMDPDLAQAFAGHKTAAALKTFAADSVGGATAAAALCSAPGQILQGAASIFAAGFTAFMSGGTLTPAVVALFAAKTTASLAISTVGLHFLTHWIISSNTAHKLAANVFSTPTGGNLLAFGARALAGADAIANGGISQNNNASTLGLAQEDQQEEQAFKSESLYARLFNTNDYHSLAGHLAETISSNPGGMTGIFSTLMRPTSILSSAFSSLMPKVGAAGVYDWGFPQYGLPDSMLNASQLADPYANATDAATILNNDNSYVSKATTCFGVTLSSSDGAWDSIPTTQVDPESSDYNNANCDDIGKSWDSATTDQQNWQRIIMFVYDSATVKTAACFQGDGQSCTDMGFGYNGTAGSGTQASGTGAIDQTTVYQDSTNVPCAAGTTDEGIHAGYHENIQIPVRLCAIPGLKSSGSESSGGFGSGYNDGDALVNSRVSASFLQMTKDAATDSITLSAKSSFRSMADQQHLCPCDGVNKATPGYSNHQMGLAIDFAVPENNTGSCSSGRAEDKGNPMWDWLNNNAKKYGIEQYGHEAWHWDVLNDSTRCGGDGT